MFFSDSQFFNNSLPSPDLISCPQGVNTTIHVSAYSTFKRYIDILGGFVGLVITALIFIPIAIAIKWDSQGPVLYSQIRCGLNGKPFRIWKFRSMYSDADQKKHLVENKAKGHIFKNDQDPRITRVGAFLRKTSLDEFPQFWNVLLGDMSLVGTRPPTICEVSHYSSRHWLRLRVKPGITGEWQVNGRSLVDDFEQIVSLDLQYQRKWSIWYDLALIIATVKVVLLRKGAH
ncbi:sugar transferase [Cyanobacterium aponinum IPPAS B-1201]|uniref:Undecaprenyl-phosphate galactose phosphotransferase n=2 Tax=Cyanobacterium TaxID=102234 RepID=K9Z765_CYAAP|nr:sugar transferase [Cyanobacterium aponinum]AFZ54415.1 Undecaprenyl-phosphate galactose phosphotransferase [Cyanobacterium aponinum PCC 10605]PHV62568.1 sugar transferase [Cyanobacterium aponinum IPPAS B-1201]